MSRWNKYEKLSHGIIGVVIEGKPGIKTAILEKNGTIEKSNRRIIC